MFLERSFIAIEQGNSRFSLGILEFLTGNSSFLGVRGFLLRNSRIPYYVIPQLDWGSLTIGILKFRHCEGAKQRE